MSNELRIKDLFKIVVSVTALENYFALVMPVHFAEPFILKKLVDHLFRHLIKGF